MLYEGAMANVATPSTGTAKKIRLQKIPPSRLPITLRSSLMFSVSVFAESSSVLWVRRPLRES
jgi:hypothetical protein